MYERDYFHKYQAMGLASMLLRRDATGCQDAAATRPSKMRILLSV